MGKFKDIVGQKFGRLTAIKEVGDKKYLCYCECGNSKDINKYSLLSGDTKSCGCLNKELRTKRGLYDSKLYNIHKAIKRRCYNENDKGYKNYGGRGISVHNEWLGEKGFINFYNWAMNNGYREGLSIDRKEVNGNYEPSNCRWTTMDVQANNKRENRNVTINGEIKTLAEWAKFAGIGKQTLKERLNNNWPEEDLLKKVTKFDVINTFEEINGERKTIKEWAEMYNLKHYLILRRYKEGDRGRDLIRPLRQKIR